MSNILRIKRRTSGNAGAPSSLENAELAFNEVDNTLYYGKGTGGAGGTATTVEAIAGIGAFVGLTGAQTIAGVKTFSSSPIVPTVTAGDNSTKVASTAYVDSAISAASIPDGDKVDIIVSNSGATWTIDTNSVSNTKLADMPANTLKGNNTGSTGNPDDLTVSEVKNMLALNNVNNTSDANKPISTATQTALDGKLAIANNLSDLASAETARTNLGLGNVDNTSDLNKPISTATQTALDGKAEDDEVVKLTGAQVVAGVKTFSSSPVVPTLSTSDDSTKVASTAFVHDAISVGIAANDAMTYKGAINASTNPNYPAGDAGDTYRISVAGKIGGASGEDVEVGDMIICLTDSTSAGTQATVGSDWNIIQQNLDGAVLEDTTQTISGNKTFTGTIALAGATVTGLDKGDVGLGNVDNTSDANKPVSSAQQTALNLKANIASPTFTGVPAAPTPSTATNTTQIATTAYVKSNLSSYATTSALSSHTGNTSNPHSVTKTQVGLGNVDNTSDLDKPVSTATSTQLGLKLAKASNLSDLANASTARTNLGLGTMAVQNANSVDIDGGTIDGVTINGGTF